MNAKTTNPDSEMFVVMSLCDLHLADGKVTWADGQIGALPVFSDRSAADRFAGDGERVLRLIPSAKTNQ